MQQATTRPAEERTTVAIVGAGMSGLIAARALLRQGIDVRVLESADRVGGRILAETSALGSRLDLGGQWVGRGHHRFTALAEELGATIFSMHTPNRPVVVQSGRSVRMLGPAAAVAAGTLLGLELMARLGVPERWKSTTVDAWLGKIPNATARRLLEVFVEVSTTADSDRFSMGSFAAMVRYQGGLSAMLSTRDGAQDSLLAEGAGTLTDKLAAELGSRVLTESPVTTISRSERGVALTSGKTLLHAKLAIVCLPPPMFAGITFEPPLPPEHARLTRKTYMGSVYKAIAVYDAPFWRATADAEVLLLDSPACAIFDTSPPDGPGHLCVLVGGREARTLDRLDESARREAVLRPLADALGLPEIRKPVSWHEKSWQLDEHVHGGYSALPTVDSTEGLFPLPSNPIDDTIFWAGTETASEHAGYIEGAIESGERAAREALEALRRDERI